MKKFLRYVFILIPFLSASVAYDTSYPKASAKSYKSYKSPRFSNEHTRGGFYKKRYTKKLSNGFVIQNGKSSSFYEYPDLYVRSAKGKLLYKDRRIVKVYTGELRYAVNSKGYLHIVYVDNQSRARAKVTAVSIAPSGKTRKRVSYVKGNVTKNSKFTFETTTRFVVQTKGSKRIIRFKQPNISIES
ncbi:hypothetical protein [Kurthia senegalensis]|uniref:hypothetical protein n=1 Tax=Kurthia senegalensis TaxID=1033740 RepID=UPI000289593A|nr:hypothetical protein [Kurthia senegalensis]